MRQVCIYVRVRVSGVIINALPQGVVVLVRSRVTHYLATM